MKKMYSKPTLRIEAFEANEYVASCMIVTVQCTLPGDNPNTHDGTTPWYYENGDRRFPHGACANKSTVSVNVGTGTGTESNGGIITITGVSATIGSYTGTWTSTDGQATYHHKGTVDVQYQDRNRPNHS